MRAAIVAIAICATSCAGGPIDTPQTPALVQAALPADAGSPLLTSRGTWFVNSRGYSNRVFARTQMILGLIAITEQGLYFAEWDARAGAYVVIKRIRRDEINELQVAENGRSRLLVIQQADLTFHSFEFGQAHGIGVDTNATLRASELLRPAS